jgi:hypothetical protein
MTDENLYNDQPTWSAWEVCLKHWRAYAVTATMAVLLAMVVCSSIPKSYSAKVIIANEKEETDLLLGLNSFASWAKTAMNDQEGLRQPEVYSKLVSATDFAEEMAKVRIPPLHTDYYHHILDHHRTPWWQSLFTSSTDEHTRIIDIIQDNIRSKASSKYKTITIRVNDQDPLVAALIADSARIHLQRHMADYARDRAHRDLVQAAVKLNQEKERFTAARNDYVHFRETHNDLSTPRVISMEEHLQKEYASAFTGYSKAMEQYRRNQALVGKFSYTFAVLSNSTVPLHPSSPAIVGYILSFVFLALTLTTWAVLLQHAIRTPKVHSPWI